MKRKLIISLIVLALIVVTLFIIACEEEVIPPGEEEEEIPVIDLTLGTSEEGSLGYAIGATLAKLVTDYAPHVNMTFIPTEGGLTTYRLYDRGEIENIYDHIFGVKMSYNDEGPFAEEPTVKEPYQVWVFLSMPALHFVAPADRDDINSWGDLAGKKVWPAPAGTTPYWMYLDLLTALGIWDEIEVVQMGPEDLSDALKMGAIEVAGLAGDPSQELPGWIQQIDATVELKLVPPSDEELAIMQALPGHKFELVTSTAGYQQDMGVTQLWVATTSGAFLWGCDTDEIYIYEIIKVITEHEAEIQASLGVMQDYSFEVVCIPGYDLLPDVPLHPGVVRYLQEIGEWQEGRWLVGECD